MATEEWEKTADGTPVLGRVIGWQIGMRAREGAIRFDYVHSREQASRGEHESCQIALSVPQMRELAELLLQTSRLLEHQEQNGPFTE